MSESIDTRVFSKEELKRIPTQRSASTMTSDVGEKWIAKVLPLQRELLEVAEILKRAENLPYPIKQQSDAAAVLDGQVVLPKEVFPLKTPEAFASAVYMALQSPGYEGLESSVEAHTSSRAAPLRTTTLDQARSSLRLPGKWNYCPANTWTQTESFANILPNVDMWVASPNSHQPVGTTIIVHRYSAGFPFFISQDVTSRADAGFPNAHATGLSPSVGNIYWVKPESEILLGWVYPL